MSVTQHMIVAKSNFHLLSDEVAQSISKLSPISD